MRSPDVTAEFADRRRSASARRRWRVRAELAATWTGKRWPWRVVCGVAGVQPVLDRVIAADRFDVIAFEEDLMSVLRLPADIPRALTEHEAFQAPASDWRASRMRDRPEQALRRADWRRWDGFRRTAWKRADLIQVYSHGDAAAIERQEPEIAGRVRVNPFGLVPPRPADPDRERSGTVLFTGTFTHLPNRDAARWLATEIMPAVRSRAPEAHLQIVGSSPPREILELAGPGVEVIGDAASMDPYLEAAAVVLAPVRSGGGMRMKVLEAMARQKAVVTTPLGAEGFTGFEQTPPLEIAESGEAIAVATADLLGDRERRRVLAAVPASLPAATTARRPGRSAWRRPTRRPATSPRHPRSGIS